MTSVAIANANSKPRYRLATPTVTIEEVVEYIKVHAGACPRDMCRKKKDFKNKMVYFFLFKEVHRRYTRDVEVKRIRTEWKTIGDGLGYPSRQLHYFWIF